MKKLKVLQKSIFLTLKNLKNDRKQSDNSDPKMYTDLNLNMGPCATLIFAQQIICFQKFQTISYLCLFGVLKLGSNSRHPTTSKMVSSANISSKSAFLFNKKIFLKISYRWCNPSVFSRSSHIWNRLSNFLMYPVIGKENNDLKSMNLIS